MSDDFRRNGSGYFDPTAGKALASVERDEREEEFHELLDTIFKICKLSGFHIEERIVIRDIVTGKVWR